MKDPILCGKADKDYKHEDVKNRTQTTTGQNLEMEGKVAKIIAGN